MRVQFEVNGKSVSIDTAPNTLLVQALRGELQLTGTHVGCDTAQCGACTVLVNGRSIKSCNVLAAQVDGAKITTIRFSSSGRWKLRIKGCESALIVSIVKLLTTSPVGLRHALHKPAIPNGSPS